MEENGRLVQFIFRDKEVLTEESEAGTVRYIRTHELLASDAEHARTYYHYASDEMGSITHVTEGEEVLNRYSYDAWGNISEKEEAVENRFCFAGEQYDPISQQYYLRARFYNPVIGRFTQEDTYRGDGLNLYVYCQNNPIYYVDPSGHFCIPMAEKILAAISDGTVAGQDLEKLKKYLTEKKKLDAGDKLVAEKLGISNKVSISDSGNIDYKNVFFSKHPELEGKVIVHHSIEQQVLKRYPGLFTKGEINAYEMLRGIPKEVNSNIHLSKIRIEWNNFYKRIDAGEVPLTKDSFLNKAKEIDCLFGSKFNPPK